MTSVRKIAPATFGLRWPSLLLVSALILALAAWDTVAEVSADDVILSVSPSLVEVTATQNGNGSQVITVYNDGAHAMSVTASIELYKDAAGDFSAVDWLDVQPKSFSLDAGTSRDITVTIHMPAAVKSGGRYAMVAVKAGAAASAGDTGVSGQLGVPFLIIVNGNEPIVHQAKVETVFPVVNMDGRTGAALVVQNDGNVHVVGSAQLQIADSDGASVGALAIEESTAIIPHTSAMLFSNGDLVLDEGKSYRLTGTVSYKNGASEKVDKVFVFEPLLEWHSVEISAKVSGVLQLEGALHNHSEVAIYSTSRFALADASGRILRTTASLPAQLIVPTMTLAGSYPLAWQLEKGPYKGVLAADYGGDKVASITKEFTVGVANIPTPSAIWPITPTPQAPAKEGIPGPLVAAAFLALVLVVAVLLTLLISRRRKDQPGGGH